MTKEITTTKPTTPAATTTATTTKPMFCFQCEQTAGGKACTLNGVCGKNAGAADLQDTLTGELVGLARAADGNELSEDARKAMVDGLFATVTNVNFDDEALNRYIDDVRSEKAKLVPRCGECVSECGRNDAYDMTNLWEEDEDIRSLKSLLLFGLRGMAAYAHHAHNFGLSDETIDRFFFKGLMAVGASKTPDELLALVMELGEANYKCMELLDAANTGAYGQPEPTDVSRAIESGPFIIVSGHDLRDLELLLKQTEGKNVNIYTHGEMLPAHAYPELKRHAHLKGHFGTSWQNQQHEFNGVPGVILFTTNCIMPVKANYADRVFTTAVAGYPGATHIGADKDFTPVINKALELGGYAGTRAMAGINGGTALTTGFARNAVLSVADKVIDAVKSGAIKHIFLVGGCDGAKPGRNYYTEFVKQTPKDSVILTLACGKFRFNDIDAGEIGGLTRIMDMGQCNDAYGAISVALALSGAFGCGVNDLPLTLVLSWYEQKAVAILLTLLSLGIKNIYIGPSLPAFISPNILSALVEKYNLTPISTPEADLRKILGH